VVSSNGNAVAQKFGYNGKEYSEELGINTLDYGARNYDPFLGRWFNVDPAADVLESSSPYVYALNSPIVYLDEDGELPILINGRVSNDSERGDESYWDFEIIATIKGSGIANPGGQIHYVDGDRGYHYSPRTRKGYATKMHSMFPSNRYNGGYAAAGEDIKDILSKLEKDPETGKITEKIQIYTHSRGAAFAAGYTARLLKYIKDNSEKFADPNNVIEFSINLAPHQSNFVKVMKEIPTLGLSHDSDVLSGNDIEGADNISSDVGNVATSHQNKSFVKELKTVLSAIASDKKLDKSTVNKITKEFEKLGIKFTYKDK
jgi:RHS repeat-associated protein